MGYVSFAIPSPPSAHLSDEIISFTANGCPSYGKLGQAILKIPTPTCSVVLIKRPILLYNWKINYEGQFLLAGLHCSTLSSGWRMFGNSLHWQNKRKKSDFKHLARHWTNHVVLLQTRGTVWETCMGTQIVTSEIRTWFHKSLSSEFEFGRNVSEIIS